MDPELHRLQGNAQCPRVFWDVTASYSCSQMSIVDSKLPIDLEKGGHEHESYEFVIPITVMPYVKLGKEKLCYEPNKIYPINSGQLHGTSKAMNGLKLMSIMIDKSRMDHMTYTIMGKTDISFGNTSLNLDAELRILIQTFMKESNSMQMGYEFILQSISTQILINLMRNSKESWTAAVEKRSNISHSHRINRVIEMIRECYNRSFSLEDLATESNLSPYHFIRAFKNQTGQTPYDYLINIRIDKAKELMNLNLSITDICLMCGFNNHSHFATVFKKKVGITPSQYRQMLLK